MLDRLHRVLHGERRIGDDLASNRFRRREKLPGLGYPVQKTDSQSLVRRNHLAAQDQLMGDSLTAETGEALRTAVAGENADLDFRLAELRRATGDADRARQRQFTAAAQRKPVDR